MNTLKENRMNTRRKLVVAMGAGAFAPRASFAQAPGKVWRIGFLLQRHMDFVDSDFVYGPFTQGLRELGYVVGKNLVIEWRSAEGNVARLPELAAELVRLNVDLLATSGTPATLAAQKATTTIPIVMINVGDPVGSGLIKSLARPGGNSTGVSNINVEIAPKLLEMLRAMVPKATRVAMLVNPANPTNKLVLKNTQVAAEKIGVTIQSVEAGTPEEIANAFSGMVRNKAEALIVPLEATFQQQKQKIQLVELAAKHRLPTIGAYGEFVEAGGLMSYGQSLRENCHRAATYVDKIFKGAKPGDIPVEQPMRFEMVVNLKTAKALGLKVPHSILIQATKVIE